MKQPIKDTKRFKFVDSLILMAKNDSQSLLTVTNTAAELLQTDKNHVPGIFVHALTFIFIYLLAIDCEPNPHETIAKGKELFEEDGHARLDV